MGTNYYTIKNCEMCGQPTRDKHIGKSSVGWKFAFRKYADVQNIKDLEKYIEGKSIIDEYGQEHTHAEFWRMIGAKQKSKEDDTDISELVDGYVFIEREFS